MSRVQYTGYAKDKGYQQRNLPIEQILNKQARKDEDTLSQISAQAKASIEEGESQLTAIKNNQTLTETIRQGNERLEDTYRANRKEAVIKRRDTEVDYYNAQAGAIKEQGELLAQFSKSIGNAATAIIQHQATVSQSKALNQDLITQDAGEQFADENNLDSTVHKPEKYEVIQQKLAAMKDRESLKVVNNAKEISEQRTTVKKITDELTAVAAEEKRSRDIYYKDRATTLKYIERDRINEITAGAAIWLEEQNPGIKLKTKGARITLAQATIIEDFKSVLQHLQKQGIQGVSFNNLSRIASSIVIRHYGLKDIHTPAAVNIKQQLSTQRKRATAAQFRSNNKASNNSGLDHHIERIKAEGKNFRATGDASGLWFLTNQIEGEGSVYWNPDTNSSFSSKDAVFGTPYSTWDILRKHDPEAARLFLETRPSKHGEFDKSQTVYKKYPDIRTHQANVALASKKQREQQIESDNALQDVHDSYQLKLRFLGDPSAPPDSPERLGKRGEWYQLKEKGSILAKEAWIAKEHAWIINNVPVNHQPEAKLMLFTLSDGVYFETGAAIEMAKKALEDENYELYYSIVENPRLPPDKAEQMIKYFGPQLNLMQASNLNDEVTRLALKGVGLHQIGKPINASEVSKVQGTIWKLKADYHRAVEELRPNYNPEDYGKLHKAAMEEVQKKWQAGVNNQEFNEYNTIASDGTSDAKYVHDIGSTYSGLSRPRLIAQLDSVKGSTLEDIASGKVAYFDVYEVQQLAKDHVIELPGGIVQYEAVTLTPDMEMAYLYKFPEGKDSEGRNVSRVDFFAAVVQGTNTFVNNNKIMRRQQLFLNEDIGALGKSDRVVRDQYIAQQYGNIGQTEFVKASNFSEVIKPRFIVRQKTQKDLTKLDSYATIVNGTGKNPINGHTVQQIEGAQHEPIQAPEGGPLFDSRINRVIGIFRNDNPNVNLTYSDFIKGSSSITNRGQILMLNPESENAEVLRQWIKDNPDVTDAFISTCTTGDLRELTLANYCFSVKY